MANASSKRIAQSNEAALLTVRLGILISNLLAAVFRGTIALITKKPVFTSTKILVLQILAFALTIGIWRWFAIIGTPKRDATGNVRAGDDLNGKGSIMEIAWDIMYMTWICTLGSALLGNWIWYLYLFIPGMILFKIYNLARPLLGMFLPGIFGPRAPAAANNGAAAEPAQNEGESKRQAKLRARSEKGDKRVQAKNVQR